MRFELSLRVYASEYFARRDRNLWRTAGRLETSELYQQTEAAVLHLSGALDEYYPPARVENYAAQLRTRARDVEFRSYDAGHEISPAMREDIRAWLTFKSEV